MNEPGSITRCLTRLREGDMDAVQPLWQTYFARLVGLARQRLRGAARRAADEEDVALSAFDSFCRAAAAGRFPRLEDRHSLWPLLVTITAHKCVDVIRRENRGGGEPRAAEFEFDELISQEPSPEMVAQATELLGQLLTALDRTGDPDLRRVALARLEGVEFDSIAERLGCVRRTIQNKLVLIARIWEREAEA
jgi:RNA polymerase sigma factor (sigma-70 family)